MHEICEYHDIWGQKKVLNEFLYKIVYRVQLSLDVITGLILGLRPANAIRRNKVTPSLIGWAQTQNQPYDNKDDMGT